MKKSFKNLVSKFETENKNVSLDHVIVEFSKFMQDEGVEPCKHQQIRENYRQLLCRRIAEKVNKTNEMTDSEGYLLKDYLCNLIHSTGRDYITIPVEEINDDAIQDVITEAVDKISSDEIEKGNVPNYFLTYAPEAEAILSAPFYSIIDEMKKMNKDKIKRLLRSWEIINDSCEELKDQIYLLGLETENEEEFNDKEYLENLQKSIDGLAVSVEEVEFSIEDLGNALNLSYKDIE